MHADIRAHRSHTLELPVAMPINCPFSVHVVRPTEAPEEDVLPQFQYRYGPTERQQNALRRAPLCDCQKGGATPKTSQKIGGMNRAATRKANPAPCRLGGRFTRSRVLTRATSNTVKRVARGPLPAAPQGHRREVHDLRVRRVPVARRRGVGDHHVAGHRDRDRGDQIHDPAADRRHGEFDFYGHADHRAWIWLRPYEPPAEATDAEYPFWLSIGSVLEHAGTGTLTRRIPTLHRAVPGAYVELNARDAQALGIRNGGRVRLVSRRGALELPARVDVRSQPARGQVFVPSFDEHAPANLLTLDACCPLSGQPDYQKCAVRVERVT